MLFVISEKYVVLRWAHVYNFWFVPISELGKIKRAGIRGTLQTWKGRDSWAVGEIGNVEPLDIMELRRRVWL